MRGSAQEPYDEEEEPSVTPEYHMNDEEVENARLDYSDRTESDFVVTRPLSMFTENAARAWGGMRYGSRLRSVVAEPAGDVWVFTIRAKEQ